MPFHGFANFDECVSKMTAEGNSDESAHKICGKLQSETEGKEKDPLHMIGEDYAKNMKSKYRYGDPENPDWGQMPANNAEIEEEQGRRKRDQERLGQHKPY